MDKPHLVLEFEKPLRELEKQMESLRRMSKEQNISVSKEVTAIEKKIANTKKEIFSNLTAWQKVQLARHPLRPHALDYIKTIFEDFQELHGDRRFRDDRALIGGTAFFEQKPVMIIAEQKGRDTKDKLANNFGMPNPEGYRKANRLMKLAEKFNMPVICIIDTPGAHCGIGAEERHVAEAIAVNLRDMSSLKVPIIAVVIGEGGSGGALGIGVADKVLIMQYAYYSVISPEGCAAILWKDRANSPKAAAALKISAQELKELGVIDEIINEPFGGAHRDPAEAGELLKNSISSHLNLLRDISTNMLVEQRYQKFRNMGVIEKSSSKSNKSSRTDSKKKEATG